MVLGREKRALAKMCNFKSMRVFLNGSIFLSSFPKCSNCCQNKAHQQSHLKLGTTLKSVQYGRVQPRDHLGFSLSGVFI